jgi:aspartate racemase
MKTLMNMITAIKSGDQGGSVKAGMESVADALVEDGADVLIAGCTEIPIVFEGRGFSVPVVASTNVLAQRTLEFATGKVPLPTK